MMIAQDQISTALLYEGWCRISGAMYKRVPHCDLTFLGEPASIWALRPKSTILMDPKYPGSATKMFSNVIFTIHAWF